MSELQAAWHAYQVFHDVARLLLLPVVGVPCALVWFLGRNRADEDGSTRVVTSVAIRGIATVGELETLIVLLGFKQDLLFVAKARPVWGGCATVVLGSGVGLILWAFVSHFRDSSVKLDILDASERTSRAAARFLRVEDLQTNAAIAWIAAFSIALIWLGAIAMGH